MPGKIPKYGPQLVLFMKTNPVVNDIEPMCAFLEQDVTAFSVRVVAQCIEEDNGLEKLLVCFRETEVMIFGVVVDQLLKGTGTVRTLVAQCSERNDVKTKILADEVCGDFAARQAVLRKIPKRLFAAHGFVYRVIFSALMMDHDKKCVIRAKSELARDLIIAML